MHEMSLSMDTVDLVVEQATQQGFNKVTKVWLEIGVLSCVEPGGRNKTKASITC